MSLSSDEEYSPEGVKKCRQPLSWLLRQNDTASPSEQMEFDCPYTLRKTNHIVLENHQWTVGDIVSTKTPISLKYIYAQIIELLHNNLCERRAVVMWLSPKSNIGVTDELHQMHHDNFNPNDFALINMDKRLVFLDCLKFIMRVPNQLEYKKYIGTDYLVDTQIISHGERYTESDEDDEPKSKSKVRRLLNK